MSWLVGAFLFLHVAGAIVAFGPTYAFPFVGIMAGREPPHANFALRLQKRIASGLVLPLAGIQAITGIGLIWTVPVDIFNAYWLVIGIVLYVIAFSISLFVLLPELNELIELSAAPRPAAAEGAPAGPPPRVAQLVQRSRMLGGLNAVLVLVIVLLMVGGTNGLIG
jgi:uncharacterized membrane protein